MGNCYDMARELGTEILRTQEYAQLKAATAVFNESDEAGKRLDAYYKLRQKGESLTDPELEDMAEKLINDPEIGPMIEAQNEFNDLVNTVMDILRAMITGEMPEGCGKSCDSCQGC